MNKKVKIAVFIFSVVLTAGTLFATVGRKHCREFNSAHCKGNFKNEHCNKSEFSDEKKESQ